MNIVNYNTTWRRRSKVTFHHHLEICYQISSHCPESLELVFALYVENIVYYLIFYFILHLFIYLFISYVIILSSSSRRSYWYRSLRDCVIDGPYLDEASFSKPILKPHNQRLQSTPVHSSCVMNEICVQTFCCIKRKYTIFENSIFLYLSSNINIYTKFLYGLCGTHFLNYF